MPPLHKENEKSKETISQNSFYPRYAREFMLKNKFNTNKEQINKNKGLSDLKDRKFFILLYMLFIIIPFLSIITLYVYRDVFMHFIDMIK